MTLCLQPLSRSVGQLGWMVAWLFLLAAAAPLLWGLGIGATLLVKHIIF